MVGPKKIVIGSPDRLFKWDKMKHFTFSFYLTTTSFYALHKFGDKNRKNALTNSTIFSFSCGLGKEVFDLYNESGNSDLWDIIANITGSITGILIINGITDG